jgi:hypothetical protein
MPYVCFSATGAEQAWWRPTLAANRPSAIEPYPVGEEPMKHRIYLSVALLGTLVVSACGDAAIEESVTGMPSLNQGRGTTHCEGTLPPGVYENVIVLPEKQCVLLNSTIIRDVKALPRSELFMVDNQVGGDIEGHNATSVIVQGGTVGSDIRIKGGEFIGVGASINRVVVREGNIEVDKVEAGIIFIGSSIVERGDVLASDNVATIFQIQVNNVAGRIEVNRNTGPGEKQVWSNTAGEVVSCFDNDPPFLGGPNVAPRHEGQCF